LKHYNILSFRHVATKFTVPGPGPAGTTVTRAAELTPGQRLVKKIMDAIIEKYCCAAHSSSPLPASRDCRALKDGIVILRKYAWSAKTGWTEQRWKKETISLADARQQL